MTVDLFVQRGAGGHPGENIVDPLVASLPVAIQRGRNELDARAHHQPPVELEAVFRAGVRLGQLARDHDLHAGEIWNGMVEGITHRVSKAGDSVQYASTLTILRPVE